MTDPVPPSRDEAKGYSSQLFESDGFPLQRLGLRQAVSSRFSSALAESR